MKYIYDKRPPITPLIALWIIWLTVTASLWIFADWLIMLAYEIGLLF